MTTFVGYGEVPGHRQAEILRAPGQTTRGEDRRARYRRIGSLLEECKGGFLGKRKLHGGRSREDQRTNDEGSVRFAPLATRLTQRPNMSRWASKRHSSGRSSQAKFNGAALQNLVSATVQRNSAATALEKDWAVR
jgi:hypothetical protein